MGKEVRLSQVEVLFSSDGARPRPQIYLGNSAAMSKTALSDFTLVSPSASATGRPQVPGQQPGHRPVRADLAHQPAASCRRRPPGAPAGHTYYEGQIYNVVVRGSAVSGSS